MSDISAFFEERFNKVKAAQNTKVVRIAKVAYTAIMRDWPVYTGFSKSGNQISITGRAVRVRSNAVKPSKKGALVDRSNATEARNLAKLKSLKDTKARTIVIGNGVDYAAELAKHPGLTGKQIYTNAIAEGKAFAKIRR